MKTLREHPPAAAVAEPPSEDVHERSAADSPWRRKAEDVAVEYEDRRRRERERALRVRFDLD